MTSNVSTPPCIRCGRRSVVTVDAHGLALWRSGAHIQAVWPDKSDAERELLVTGIHEACWNELFPPEEDE